MEPTIETYQGVALRQNAAVSALLDEIMIQINSVDGIYQVIRSLVHIRSGSGSIDSHAHDFIQDHKCGCYVIDRGEYPGR